MRSTSSSAGSAWADDDGLPGCRIYTASLNPTSDDYIAKILNTDPNDFQEKQHLLYLDLAVENELAPIYEEVGSPAGVGGTIMISSGSMQTNVNGGQSDTWGNSFGRFDTRYTTPLTPAIISQPFGGTEYDLFHFEKIQRMIEIGDIEIAPLAFMRGRTLKNSFAILDEAQNATDTQIKMFLTRIGENSKIVINGDPSQIDLPNKSLSGLNRSKKLLGHLNEISVVDFDHSDVVRHPLVSKIVKAYSDQNKE